MVTLILLCKIELKAEDDCIQVPKSTQNYLFPFFLFSFISSKSIYSPI